MSKVVFLLNMGISAENLWTALNNAKRLPNQESISTMTFDDLTLLQGALSKMTPTLISIKVSSWAQLRDTSNVIKNCGYAGEIDFRASSADIHTGFDQITRKYICTLQEWNAETLAKALIPQLHR